VHGAAQPPLQCGVFQKSVKKQKHCVLSLLRHEPFPSSAATRSCEIRWGGKGIVYQ
jgi:hypothetical protein